jgi:hypothetical protein
MDSYPEIVGRMNRIIRRFLMVTFIRSAAVNGNENQQKAMEWAKRIAKYVDGKFGFSDLQVGL